MIDTWEEDRDKLEVVYCSLWTGPEQGEWYAVKKAFVSPTVIVKHQSTGTGRGAWVYQSVCINVKTMWSVETSVWADVYDISHFCSVTASCSCSSDAESSVTSVVKQSSFMVTGGTSSFSGSGWGSVRESSWLEDASADSAASWPPLSRVISQFWSEGWGRLAMSSLTHTEQVRNS